MSWRDIIRKEDEKAHCGTEKADDDVLREALWLLSMIFCTCVASCYFIGAGYTSLILLVFCAYKYFKHRM